MGAVVVAGCSHSHTSHLLPDARLHLNSIRAENRYGLKSMLQLDPAIPVVILHDELYRKRFLPTVTDADLDHLARKALHEKVSEDK